MLKVIFGLFTVLAFFGVGSINRPNANQFDTTINSLYKIFSSIYLYLIFSNWLRSVEPQIVQGLFMSWSDWFLFQCALVGTSWISVIATKPGGLAQLMVNLGLSMLFPDVITWINFAFGNLIFEHIVVPIIQISTNGFKGLNLNQGVTQGPQNKLKEMVVMGTTVYFFVIIIMIHKHKLIL